jgi:hypothetical protein
MKYILNKDKYKQFSEKSIIHVHYDNISKISARFSETL